MSITSDDKAALEVGLLWAKATREQLMAGGSAKPEQQPKSKEINGEGEIPVCPIHNQPMTKEKDEFGAFWSCHQGNEDVGFCSYRPDCR